MATLLNGVNTLLMARGLAPVNAAVSGHPLHSSAVELLERKREEINSNRWWYNTKVDYQLAIDPLTNKVPVPSTVLDLDDTDYLLVSGYLYDPEEGTDIFTDDPDEVTLIYNTEWEYLPVVAFNHIEAQAKEEFIRPLNDRLKTTQAEKDITRTLGYLQASHLRHKDVSISTMPLYAKWKSKMVIR